MEETMLYCSAKRIFADKVSRNPPRQPESHLSHPVLLEKTSCSSKVHPFQPKDIYIYIISEFKTHAQSASASVPPRTSKNSWRGWNRVASLLLVTISTDAMKFHTNSCDFLNIFSCHKQHDLPSNITRLAHPSRSEGESWAKAGNGGDF